MAAINFPDSPSNGDTHTVGGVTYTYNSAETKWKTTINSNAFLPLSGGNVTGNLSVDTDTLFVDASANRVGVGTSSPTARLNVNSGGTDLNADFVGTSSPYIRIDNGTKKYIAQVIGSDFRIQDQSASAERLRIDSSGNVGIGTASPNSNYGTNVAIHDSGTSGARLKLSTSGTGEGNTDGFDLISTGSNAFILNRESGTLSLASNNTTAAEIASGGEFRFNSGYGSVARAYGCRAWASWRGDITSGGNSQLNGSGNVSSVTDNGAGDYTINFTNAMPDQQYVVVGNCIEDATNNRGDHLFTMHRSGRATGSVRVNTINLAGTPIDDDFVFAAVIR